MSREEGVGSIWPSLLATFVIWLVVVYQVYLLWEPPRGYPYLLGFLLFCAAFSTFFAGMTIANVKTTRQLRKIRLELERKLGK